MKNFKLTHKLAAAMTAGALMSKTGAAFAAEDFSDMTDHIIESSSKFPNLISTVAYIGGLGLGVAGIFKLKQHVDNPGQHAMKDGLIRLAVGGGLLVLPYVTGAAMDTISNGDTGTKPSTTDLQFDPATFQ